MQSRGPLSLLMPLVGCLLLAHLGQTATDTGRDERVQLTRVERQSPRGERAHIEAKPASRLVGVASASAVSSSAVSSIGTSRQPPDADPPTSDQIEQRGPADSLAGAAPVSASSGHSRRRQQQHQHQSLDEPRRPTPNRPDSDRRVAHPSRDEGHSTRDRHRPDELDDQDYECRDNHDYDYNQQQFLQMAANPMKQIGRMMNDIFSRMPAIGYGLADYDGSGADYGPAGSMASSSTFGNSDGYTRLSSTVSNNGRTRGIISETRNGRTQTRRTGDDDQDEPDQ